MQRFILFLFLISILNGCQNQRNTTGNRIDSSNHFAHGFQIKKIENITKLTVFNPWEKARNISVEYFLLNEKLSVPDSLSSKKIIRTPVKKIICMSTSHLGFIDVLNENKSVVGVSGTDYVSTSEIQQRIKNGDVVDVGYGQNLNYEVILNQHPDLVMVYGVGSEVTGYAQKLEELGIPVIMNAEYLEETPLGKAEWIKFVAALFEKEKEGDLIYQKVEKNYLALKKLVENQPECPKILVGAPYRDSWWVPGGNSYMANLISDAGGDYLGKANPSHESYVVSFENTLVWGNNADIWINMGNLNSKNEIIATDERFENFGVLKKGRLFNNNFKMNEKGGNDFWESGTVSPDIILRDLISILYPGTIKEEMVYYREVK